MEGVGMTAARPFLGAVHKVCHAIFGQFWPPIPCHTLSHIPGPPKVRHTSRTPRFLLGLVPKAPCTNYLSIVHGGFCQGVFCREGFVRGDFCPYLLLSEYICYNRKLKITLNFMFHMYDKFFYKRDVTCSWPLPCHKLSRFSDPLLPSVTYFMDGPLSNV